MTQYSFETYKREDGNGIDVVVNALFEYKGENLKLSQAYQFKEGTENYKPSKESQKEMIEDINQYIHQYKLEH